MSEVSTGVPRTGSGLQLVPLTDCDTSMYVDTYVANGPDLLNARISLEEVTPEIAERHLALLRADIRNRSAVGYGIYVAGEFGGEVIATGLGVSDEPEVDYWIAAGRRGRGIGTRAVRAVVQRVFAVYPNVPALFSQIDNGNIPSTRLAARVGAKRVEDNGLVSTWRFGRDER